MTAPLPDDLTEHAARLLTGTGLAPEDARALAAAAGPGPTAHPVAAALADGWAAARAADRETTPEGGAS